MFQKYLLAAMLPCLLSFPIATVMAAGNPDNGPGCGLGNLVWQDYKAQKQIAPQVLMATTNGTFGSQTFGITFGTSGCTNNGVVMGDLRARVFTEINMANLSEDMARGGGEHLASLATLLDIPDAHHSEFFAMTQDQYLSFLEAGETSPIALVRALNKATEAHPVLAKLSTNS